VRFDGLMLGDLGHPRVDAKILAAIVMVHGEVGAWLRVRGVTPESIDPPPVSRPPAGPATGARYPTAADIAAPERQDAEKSHDRYGLVAAAGSSGRHAITVHLDALPMGDLGSTRTDARLLSAIVVRGGAITNRLEDRIGHVADVERAFPGSSWR
jgi:hypothetical protein